MKKTHGSVPLACPRCHTTLAKQSRSLNCPRCSARYPIIRGLPHLFPPPVTKQSIEKRQYLFSYCNIVELAKTVPTPFFLTSETVLRNRATTFKNAFAYGGLKTRIYYSLKTSYDPPVMRTLKSMGIGAEVGSALEMSLARNAGFPPEDLIFDGPAKTTEELQEAIESGVRTIMLDSLAELNRLLPSVPRSKTIGLGVRLRTAEVVPRSPISLAQGKFGMDMSTLMRSLLPILKKHRSLKLTTLLVHLGSQLTSPSLYEQLIARLLEVRSELRKRGISINEVNIGGGFPTRNLKLGPLKMITTLLSGQFRLNPPSLDRFLTRINRSFRALTDPKDRPILAAEPGRSLVSQTTVLVTGVVAVKPDNWLILDASTNSLPEPSYFGRHPIFLARNPEGTPTQRYHLAGSSLNTTDILGVSVALPRIKEGDILVIEEAGAYSLSRATQFTVPIPPLYWITSLGEVTEVRRRGTDEDTLAPYNV